MTGNTYELKPVSEEITDLEFDALLEKAFSKSLASAIMSNFPVASLIAIFAGKQASNLIAQIDEITERTGKKTDGRRIAARIMSKYGFICGIVLSAFWPFYIVFAIFYFDLFISLGF